MSKEENKLNHDFQNNNDDLQLLPTNNKINQEKIVLNNEYLSSLFKSVPNFEKKYENEELNKFKDEILIYLYQRNRHYMALIKHFQDKFEENKKEYIDQINTITQNYNSIISSQASLNNKIDKISNFELFINKTNDQLITHEIRINNLSSDFIKSTQKYDKIYLDNLELPGYIGKFAKFKNCQAFFENIIREIEKFNQYKEKNNIDLKLYKEKIDTIIKSCHLLVKNNNESQMKYIKQLNEKCFKECKEMNELLGNRVCDLRIENAKYSIELVKKNEEMNKEWKKILEIKDNLLNVVNEKLNHFKTIFNTNVNTINCFKKEFEEFKIKINDVMNANKEIKNENVNNNINVNLNNNSCNNYTGCYINNSLPLEKKIKNFPKKISKRSKTKNKYLEKKQFLKSISSFGTNKFNQNNIQLENIDNKKCNIIKIEKLEDNITLISKDKEHKKRNTCNSLNKEKSLNSIDKYKHNVENQTKKNTNNFKEPRSCKNVIKIEINSVNKPNNIETNKKDNINNNQTDLNDNKSNIKNINYNNENTNNKNALLDDNKNSNDNINDNNDKDNINDLKKLSYLNSNLQKEKQKEKYNDKDKEQLIHKYNKKNKKIILQSNKSVQSEDLENNSISKINYNSNTLNTTNDINYSIYSTNSVCNVNRFVLNDGLFEPNDRVIKELASELEQSTNKKDILASNAKKIEDNFKSICQKISPLNLNKNKEQKINTSVKSINENDIYQNENTNNNLNIPENAKINTISTEKTEEHKNGNNTNNIGFISINQNDYNSLNKKVDLFDKKLFDLESLVKEKLVEMLLQIDKLQKFCYSSINNKNLVNQKLNNNFMMNTNMNMNSAISLTGPNENLNSNIKNSNSHDDYFVHSHSVKRFAPIIEIDPKNLEFSPSPSRNQNQFMSSKKNKEQNKNNRGLRNGFSNNYKDIKLFKKNENKENIRVNNNFDNLDLTQFRILGKNSGVNKWINLNKLIRYEQSKTTNISSLNGGLLVNGNYDNN